MRIGLLADIHEQSAPLEQALGVLREAGMERLVLLGDVFDGFAEPDEAVRVTELLVEAGAIGVWGNHDFGLCYEVSDEVCRMYPPAVFPFTATLRPHLEIEDNLFCHLDAWRDPYEVADLWAFEGPPDTVEKARKSFVATKQQHVFMGHYHRWLAMTPDGPVSWTGDSVLNLEEDERYLVVIAPVYNGHCALLDTDHRTVEPISCQKD